MGGASSIQCPAPVPGQETFAMIKPDAVAAGKKDEILAVIKENGFEVVQQLEVTLTRERAEGFYKEHEGKGFFPELMEFVTSGPVVALILRKEDAIPQWRQLLGPTNTEKARAEAPDSIRGRFGTDATKNAAHGSDSVTSAQREIAYFFPTYSDRTQYTYGMIKPDAVAAGKADEIIEKVKAAGFEVVKHVQLPLSRERAEEFYAEHKGKGFYDALMEFMTSGPVVALALKKEKAVTSWRSFIGPTNPEKAKEAAPECIRAVYGTDGTHNAVHGSDGAESAYRELLFFFPEMTIPPFERTYAMIKPDAVGAGHVGPITDKIKENGFEIVKQHEFTMSKEKAEEFYKEHHEKAFFPELVGFMTSGPVVGLVLQKENAIKGWRELAGPTNSNKAREEAPNSIRALYGTDGQKNAVHGSDSPDSAAREIRLIFAP